MNKRIKRVFALLAAVFLFISLPLSVSAILLNPDPKDQVYNWDDTPPHVYEEGSTFWLNQPFHAYWHVEGYEEFGEDQSSGENRMIYNMIDYYWSGDCHFLVGKQEYNYAIRANVEFQAITTQSLDLQKTSERTSGTTNELIYTGSVSTGTILGIGCIDYANMNFKEPDEENYFLGRNNPDYPGSAQTPPTESSCFNAYIHAVKKNGKWVDGADDFVWEQNPKPDANGTYFTGDRYFCIWEYWYSQKMR